MRLSLFKFVHPCLLLLFVPSFNVSSCYLVYFYVSLNLVATPTV